MSPPIDDLQRRWDGGLSGAADSDAGDLAPAVTGVTGDGDHGGDGDGSGPDERSLAEGRAARAHPFAVAEAGRYEEVAELGQGGMGKVVLAVDRRLRRQVALKHIAVDLRGRPSAMRRFAREAWITASLDHPAIVPVFDAGMSPSGELYYAMRLVRGRTLGEAIQAASDLPARLALLRQFLVACEAVAYAHSQGVVHRDLKPANILVADFGETQVLDWGVARRLDEKLDALGPALAVEWDVAGVAASSPAPSEEQVASDGSRSIDSLRTVAGAVVGTPAYMSPEQASGAPPDPRADVFSLGVVLYEIVAGRPMHEQLTAATLAAEVAHPRPGTLALSPEGAPPELAAIIQHALRVDPALRYADARELAADVARYLDGAPVRVHRYSPLEALALYVRQRRAPFTVAAIAAVLLVAVGLWALVRTRADRDRAVGAERQVRSALAASSHSLARSLVEQAQAALMAGAQPEAEVLAANSLALVESPEARGVMAAFGFAGRPPLCERLDHGDGLPTCDVIRPRPDGAVLCLQDGVVSLLEGRPLRTRWQQRLGAGAVMWFAGGRRIVAVKVGARGWVLDADDGRVLAPLSFEQSWLGVTDTDSQELGLLGNGTIALIDGASARVGQSFVACEATDGNHGVALDRLGQRGAIGCRGGLVRLFSAASSTVERSIQTEFREARGSLAGVGLSSDGNVLVISSLAGEVQSLDARSGEVLARRHLGGTPARIISFAPGDRWVALLGERGAVTLLDPRSLVVRRRLPADGDQALVWSAPPGGPLELITAGPRLRRWQLTEDQPAVGLLAPDPPGLGWAELSPAGDQLAVGAGDGTVTVIDVHDGHRVLRDKFQEGVLKGGHFVDGGFIAWGTQLPSLRTYDTAWRPGETLDLFGMKRATRLPSGYLVLGRYRQGELLLAPGDRAGPRLRGFAGDGPVFLDLDQSADGRAVVLVDTDGGIVRVTDGTPPVVSPLAVRTGARAVAISGDGRTVAIADGRRIEVIDAVSAAPRAVLDVAALELDDVALSHDGRLMAVGALDHAARVWSLDEAGGAVLRAVLRGHEGRVARVTFHVGHVGPPGRPSTDGRARPTSPVADMLLVTASWDGSARVWDLSTLDRSGESLRLEAEAAWGLTLDGVGALRR